MTTPWLRLAAVRLADAPRVGGKAAGLGEAIAAGARVPAGLVVPPETLAQVAKSARLTADLAAALEAARKDDFAPAEAIAEKLLALSWPKELAAPIQAAAADLGATSFAVRSSATLEDLEATAAAGIYHSSLHVPADGLIPALNRCWAAAFAPQALAHALAHGLDPAAGKLALIVQVMLEPRAAGVVFTLDPTDAERKTLRVGLVEGQGEALVQGESGEDLRLPREGALLQAHPWLAELRSVALKLERRFGRALDLEFAYDGRVHILQARAIAGLPPGAEARPPIRWSRDLAEERFPDPISPMGWSVLQPAFRTNLRVLDQRFGLTARRPEEVARVIGGHVYNNRDFFKIPGSLRFRWAAHRPFLGAYLKLALSLATPAKLLALRAPKRCALGAGPQDPRFRAVAGLFEAFVFHHADEVAAAWTRDFPELMARMDHLAEAEFEGMDDAALLAFIQDLLAVCDAYMEPDLAIYVIKMACRWLVDEVAVLAGGERDASPLEVLTGGLEANATLAMNEAIEALGQAVAGDAYLSTAMRVGDRPAAVAAWEGSSARPLRDAFMKDYGHVTLSWDLRVPTYGEQPEVIEEMLAQRLRTPTAGRTAAARRARLVAAREAETERLAALLAPAPWAPAFFRRLLETLHTFMRLDEEHHLFCARMVPTDRRLVLELGRRFTKRGVLADPDDMFFLTLEEAQQLLREANPHSRKRLAARRRAAFERALATRPVEEYLDDQPVRAEATVPAADGTLTGRPASPGVAEGRVRVVDSLADVAAFQPGEILVTPTPKPSYTPLFAVAAALVTARGSTLSHGLITAREYGLPAVTEVHDALARLRTGQRVRVDGAAGTVEPLADSPVLPFGGRR